MHPTLRKLTVNLQGTKYSCSKGPCLDFASVGLEDWWNLLGVSLHSGLRGFISEVV